MKLSAIYRKASQMVDSGRFAGCCMAIYMARGKKVGRRARFAIKIFNDIFTPSARPANYYFNREDGTYSSGVPSSEEARSRRVIALLLAAEMLESEGD